MKRDWLPLLLIPGLMIGALPLIGAPASWVTLTVAGLAMGLMIFIMASGLTLTFGLMDVLNFGHGAFIAVGAFVAAQELFQDRATDALRAADRNQRGLKRQPGGAFRSARAPALHLPPASPEAHFHVSLVEELLFDERPKLRARAQRLEAQVLKRFEAVFAHPAFKEAVERA